MRLLTIVDSGPLIALFNRSDQHHAKCRNLLMDTSRQFVVPALCIAESAYLLNARSGWRAEAEFVERVQSLDIQLPLATEWPRIARLIRQYADFPLGAVDASVIVLAERLNATTIATLDHRHFRAVRPAHVGSFTLLPEL